MKTYPVKFFASEMQGAPQISADSTAGQLALLLKAVLVDGFGALAPDSITWDATVGLAKASISAGHSYPLDSILLFEGVVPLEFNGEHRVIKVDSTTVWFELDDGIEPSAAVSVGSMKIASLGWELTHSDVNNEILIFKPAGDVGEVSLRIDNSEFSGWSGTYARLAKVAMVEDVVDINTYTTIFEHRWAATDRYSNGGWDLVGDNRIFYYMMKYGAGQEFGGYVAGYIDSVRAGDRYHFIMNHTYATDSNDVTMRWEQSNSSYYYYTCFAANDNTGQNRIARKYHQLEGSDSWKKRGVGSRGSDVFNYPNASTNGFYVNTSPIMIQESDNTLRGYLPFYVEPMANATAMYRKNLQDLPEHQNKIFRMLLSTYDSRSDYANTLIGFDISTVEV